MATGRPYSNQADMNGATPMSAASREGCTRMAEDTEVPAGSTEEDGKGGSDEALERLEGALENEREMTKRLKRKLRTIESKIPEDFDPEHYRELQKAEEQREREAAEKEGDLEKQREILESKYQKEIAKRDERIATLESAVEQNVVHRALDEAIAEAGVMDQYRGAVRAMLREKGPKMLEESGDFRAVFMDDLGDPVDLGEFVTEWSKSDDAQAFMPGAGTSGSGREPGSTTTKTRAAGGMRVIPNDPELIAQHAEEINRGEVTVDTTKASA